MRTQIRQIGSRRFIILIGFILVVLTLGFASYIYLEGNRKSGTSKSLRDAPDFKLSDFKGKRVRLEEFRGKIILLHFWASWCPPCLEEIPKWIQFSQSIQNQPVALVSISLDQNWKDALKIFPSSASSTHLVSLLDSSGKVAEDYGSYQFPETYLITPDLKILTKWVGPQDWSGPQMKKWIEIVKKGFKENESVTGLKPPEPN